MSAEIEQQLSTLTLETLEPIVRKSLKDEEVEVIDWSFNRLTGGDINPITAGIFRFTGTAASQGAEVSWSLILKIAQWVDFTDTPLEKGYLNDPPDWNYWKREALVYQSGILNRMQGNLIPVKCFHIAEPTDTNVWIWQEEVNEPNRSQWTFDRHILAAQHFGEFAGSYIGYTPKAKDDLWFCRDFIRQWIRGISDIGLQDLATNSDFWNNDYVKLALPLVSAKRLQDLMQDAESLCNVLEKQLQTLSHQDTHWSNLFATKNRNGQETTTVIDWSFLGLAAIGEDLGTQIAGNLSNYFVDPTQAKTYYEAAFDAYLRGLRQVGWQGKENSIRFACSATAALRYATFELLMLKWLIGDKTEGKESWIDKMAQEQNQPVDETLVNWGKGITFLFDLADEAKELASRLN